MNEDQLEDLRDQLCLLSGTDAVQVRNVLKDVHASVNLVDQRKQQLARSSEADLRVNQDFLDSASASLVTRHGYAHSLWHVQGGDERPDVRKDLTQKINFTKTTAEMRADMDAVVRLLDGASWNRVIRVAQGYGLQPEELAR